MEVADDGDADFLPSGELRLVVAGYLHAVLRSELAADGGVEVDVGLVFVEAALLAIVAVVVGVLFELRVADDVQVRPVAMMAREV